MQMECFRRFGQNCDYVRRNNGFSSQNNWRIKIFFGEATFEGHAQEVLGEKLDEF